MMKRLITATAVSALLVAGCAGQADTPASAPSPTQISTDRAGQQAREEAVPLLAQYDLEGMDTVEVIDHLDRLGVEDRPADLIASVRPGELLMSADREEASLPIPEDRFYLSVAPYVDQTHDCFYHSLTTCQGELAQKELDVQIVDEASGKILVDETRKSFDNGFVGFWLPRDIEGTLEVRYDGRVGRTRISTGQNAPTCLTTLQLT